MTQILETKGGKFTILEAAGVAGLKILSENLLARTPVGNGTIKSGVIKAVGAVGLTALTHNKLANMEGTALMVDAFEDIVGSFLGGRGGSSQASSNGRQIGQANQGFGVTSVI